MILPRGFVGTNVRLFYRRPEVPEDEISVSEESRVVGTVGIGTEHVGEDGRTMHIVLRNVRPRSFAVENNDQLKWHGRDSFGRLSQDIVTAGNIARAPIYV